jgi:FixJ family two-component response regulator
MATPAARTGRGAVDFIEKPFGDKDMLRLIEQCLELDRNNRERNQQGVAAARRLAALTEREVEVMNLIIAGKLNKQVADVLNISIKTVEVHRSRIMDKMAVRTVAELVQAVMRGRQ